MVLLKDSVGKFLSWVSEGHLMGLTSEFGRGPVCWFVVTPRTVDHQTGASLRLTLVPVSVRSSPQNADKAPVL